MTAAAIAMGLRGKYPMQAARAKAFHRWLRWMGPFDGTRTIDARRATRLTFWTKVCHILDAEVGDVC